MPFLFFSAIRKLLLPAAFILLAASCNQKSNVDYATLARREHYAEVIEVRTSPAVKGNFSMELITNGRLRAVGKATVQFRVHEMVKEVHIINGQQVAQGELLAVLEDFLFVSRLERARDQVELTKLELEDILLGYGYVLQDSLRIPENIWNMARIRSGYNAARNEIAEAQYQHANTRLCAPISGVVSGLEVMPYNHSSSYENFCMIIDNSRLEARFPVLESETSMIENGQQVEIKPFADGNTRYTGKVTGFDPRVDDQGMVMVRARVDNPRGKLLDGMNVQVILKREMPGQLIIPREALVMRQGRQVVFTLSDSIALWNYVETQYGNSREFTINSGLIEGQEVIIDGNFNLAHETKVKKVN